ncbi:UDP-N-acetylmuramoyl-tripeptide--D-alanyl-D-alanine ligase [Amylibacter sp. SFDW26]|uniref:UDP-N-acetylmuramoyl-tripeptide--D-alanyl-D- alanine ligase n=1 Tax=Amylibacter sp. SFDW26 TaxID=2652722 RepID=UPI001261BFD7|nr:UDP-N-acetylmuramoyl-tripeptide--D-alanyl-D-alanine ligase [Amylibacter sp. SFDW26]KAB7610338.1 UDP-N-acetylmuramoyl-tripeptide--D-alanyl-D-alanine ligase [Amylibacter sp. SFDW26]
MSALWTWDEATAATGGMCTTYWSATGVSIDTRTLEKGDLFVALADVRDGHDFVSQALEKGAAAALVTHVPEGVSVEAPLLMVPDVLKALEDLGRYARKRIDGKVIGVTGSVGKTGTKEMLRTALTGQGNVHAAEKSYNNHWGVPLTLARMPRDTDFAVIEIGMNHPGEITPLSQMADLDVALITTVAAVHLASFSGVEEIAHAKAEIFDGLKGNGTAILNADIETLPILLNAAKKVTSSIMKFGATDGADFKMTGAYVSDTSTKVIFDLLGQKIEYTLAAPGVHLAMNSLAVLAACDAVLDDLNDSIKNLSQWTPPSGRGAREQIKMADGGQIELVDESYNANPTSMAATLDVLSHSEAKGRKIAIVGDMLELGPTEIELHRGIAQLDAVERVDQFHAVGPMMKSFFEDLPAEKRGVWVAGSDELAAEIANLLETGDTVMVKGSLGTKLAKVVDAIRKIGA